METSYEKTKRKLLKELAKEEYQYASVIFFNNYAPDIFNYAHKIRKLVSRTMNIKILWLVRAKNISVTSLDEIPENYNKKYIVQPYLQFFTSDKVSYQNVNKVLLRHDIAGYCQCKKFPPERKKRWSNTFQRQEMVNLDKFFENSNLKRTPRRWTVTNSKIL